MDADLVRMTCTSGPGGLQSYIASVLARPSWRWTGQITRADGLIVESEGPICSVGESCEFIGQNGQRHTGEVIGFRGSTVVSMPLETTLGLRYGDTVQGLGDVPGIALCEHMQGRVLNALGAPLDGRARPGCGHLRPLSVPARLPLEREPIRESLQTGVRVIDGMLSVGKGQRLGIFGGSGVGKSTLIGMMTRNTEADITVIGLVGERGREVGEFVENALGEEGRRRSVVFVSTSDQSPLLRMRAALAATACAEFYAASGKNVLLILDSLTRYAMAAREVGLAAGEPPASKGYTPGVFNLLAKLVERAGNFAVGSITAFYTVLMEGDDQQDPVVDAIRSFVDGHIVLSRSLAASGQYPPVEVLDSLSRLMPAITSTEHRKHAACVRQLLASLARNEDLIRIGAYRSGMDEELDRAITAAPKIRAFVEQQASEKISLADGLLQLRAVVSERL